MWSPEWLQFSPRYFCQTIPPPFFGVEAAEVEDQNSLGFAFDGSWEVRTVIHGNIPGRFSWAEIWWNFLWLHKKKSRVLLSKKDSKSSEWPCMHMLCENLQRYGMLEVQVDNDFAFFSCTFWRSSQDDSNMCKHFLWTDGFFLCYILRKTNFSLSG